ncbi:hypothetical protein [Streptomyces sp. NPDC059455]|uniref:hypothetical protein n=1 Tax=Streptomyces sp. NPDC059455 TaxID=3346837 RepID=UPI003686EF54
MAVSMDKTERRFTIAYAEREIAGLEIRRILDGAIQGGDDSNRPWVQLRDSGLVWFVVTAVSTGDALLKARAELGGELAAIWGEELGGNPEDGPDGTYFRTVMVTVNLDTPASLREQAIAEYAAHARIAPAKARLTYEHARRWAAALTPERRTETHQFAENHELGTLRFSELDRFALAEVMGEHDEL